jgi:hypothetical protein
VGPIPYTQLQRMFDASAPPGIRSYWKTAYLDDLTDPVIDRMVEHADRLKSLSPFSAVHMHHAGGAVARSVGGNTAFGRRDARFILNLVGLWPNPEQDAAHVDWVRTFWDAVAPSAGGGAYLNFLGDEGTDRIRAAYGPQTYDQLAKLKARYDPNNVFRINQNIQPAP